MASAIVLLFASLWAAFHSVFHCQNRLDISILVSMSGLANHSGAENVFHGGKCQICGSHLCSLTQWYSACLQKVRFWRQHLNNTKLIKSTRGLGTKDSFSHQLPAQMKAGDQLCMWHVCPAALRAVLRKVLSRGTALKLNCSSNRNENLNVNDGGKNKQTNRKRLLQKEEERNEILFEMVTAEDTCVSFWQNKRALQRNSKRCWYSKHFTVNSEIIICAHNLQRLEQKDMKMSTVFLSQRQADPIFPYISRE